MIENRQRVHLQYDSVHDILYIDIGKPCAAYSEEVDDGVFVRINPKNNKKVGLTVFSYKDKIKDIAKKVPFKLNWDDINNKILCV